MSPDKATARIALVTAVLGLVAALVSAPWWARGGEPAASPQVTIQPTPTGEAQSPAAPVEPSTPPTSTGGGQSLSEQPLREQHIVENRCQNSPWTVTTATVAGKAFTSALTCSSFWGNGVGQGKNDEARHLDLLLPSGATTVSGALGIADDSETADSNLRATVTDVATGSTLVEIVVPYGSITPFSVPVEGVRRIRITTQLTALSELAEVYEAWAATAVVGSPTVRF